MPKFVLNTGTPEMAVRYAEAPAFVRGYIEAMFFTDCTSDNPELEHMTVNDLSELAWSEILRDCKDFQEFASELLELAYERDYSEEQAGRDYWLTRNGHGAGFWDRKELTADNLGKHLSEICRHNEVSLYVSNAGKLELS